MWKISIVSWSREKVYDKVRQYTRSWEGIHAFFVYCLYIKISFPEELAARTFPLNPKKTKRTKIVCVLSADQILLGCTGRLGTMCFMQCISVIDVAVDLVWVRKYVLRMLVNILNKRKDRIYKRSYELWKKSSYF